MASNEVIFKSTEDAVFLRDSGFVQLVLPVDHKKHHLKQLLIFDIAYVIAYIVFGGEKYEYYKCNRG